MAAFEDLRDASPESLRRLNDMLRTLFRKVQAADIEAVPEEELADGSVTGDKIGGAAVAGYHIEEAAIGTAHIQDAAITNAKIASLDADKIATGTLSADFISGGTIDGENVSVTNLTADNITAGTLNGSMIGDGTIAYEKLGQTTADATLEAGAGKPYATPQDAYATLPTQINHNIVIECSSVSTSDTLEVSNLSGTGSLTIKRSPGHSATIGRIFIHDCLLDITVDGITAATTADTAVSVEKCRSVTVKNCTVSAAAPGQYGISFEKANGAIQNNSVSNRGTGITVQHQSLVYLADNAGSSNDLGVYCNQAVVLNGGGNLIAEWCGYASKDTAMLTKIDGLTGSDTTAVSGTQGAPGNLAVWDASGNAADGLLAASAALKCVSRQDNTTNNEVANQTVKMGWGCMTGNDSASTPMTESVAFDEAFDNQPVVLVCAIGARATSGGAPAGPNGFNNAGNNTAALSQTSASGFTVRMMPLLSYTMSSNYHYGYSWIAVGTKAR